MRRPTEGNRARMHVDEGFLAMQGTEDTTVLVNGVSSTCGFSFVESGRYLVYAYRTPDGALDVSECSGTMLAEKAQEDLAFLRTFATAPPFGQIFGHVVDPHKTKPIQGIRINIRGYGIERQLVTSEKGQYEFSDLAPGTYTIEAESPGKLQRVSRRVQVIPYACQQVFFLAERRSLKAFPPEEAEAEMCSCQPIRPCEGLGLADTAFVGTVSGIEDIRGRQADTPAGEGNRAHVLVEETFDGTEGKVGDEVVVASAPSCAYQFRQGASYLFYARRIGNAIYYTNSCMHQPESEAQDHLQFLRSLPGIPPTTCVFGVVKAWGKAKGMKGARIRIRGNGVSREARTNDEGQYEVSDLPAGQYTIQVIPGGIYRRETREITVRERACARLDFSAVLGPVVQPTYRQPPNPPLLRPQ